MSVIAPAAAFSAAGVVSMTGREFTRLVPRDARWIWNRSLLFPVDALLEYHVIIQDRRIVAFAATDPDFRKMQPGQREFSFIHVREDQRQKGHAQALTRAVFAQSLRDEKVLKPTGFIDAGKRYLAHVLPRIHREYPDLNIAWGDCNAVVDGRRPYTIDLDRLHTAPIRFQLKDN